MPKRVLNINDSPFLYDSEGASGSYICLSYCWGKVQNLRTTRSNIERMKEGIPWSDLPKTFQHAIMIARLVHIGFLWIDSLCIIQDDEKDWEKESACMAGIYENAFLTIAATDARDADGGYFMDMEPRDKEVYQINLTRAMTNGHSIFVRRSPNNTLFGLFYMSDYSRAPLLGRAWAFQEHILSVRVLQFAASEVRWECNGSFTCECGGNISQGEQTKQFHSGVLESNKLTGSVESMGIYHSEVYITCLDKRDRSAASSVRYRKTVPQAWNFRRILCWSLGK